MHVVHVNLAAGFRGGERQTQLLVQGLAEQGLTQTLVGRQGGELVDRCRNIPGLHVVAVRNNIVSAARALSGAALVHVHEGRAIQAAWLAHRLGKVPYLVTRRVQKGPRRTLANRIMYRTAAVRVAVSHAIGESLQLLDPRLDFRVVPDSTSALFADPAQARRIRSQYGDGVLIGTVAALVDSHKGQLQVIEIARRFAQPLPEVRFLLIGGGPDEAMLKAAAAGLPNVVFTGHVDNVGDYLAALDLFFYPSRHEGLGSILLDAMEFGLPIVATAVGGIPEIIEDGRNGFLCAVDDIGAQSEALGRLIHDTDRRAQIGAVNIDK
ncbi:MAG TPA: glycosyltransferase family 1 protein, partial [Chromatiales bacterium]|nr:glycosyltransferase family 1 protein [Chromatiales bacterium]